MVAITAPDSSLDNASTVFDYDAAVGAALVEVRCAMRNVGFTSDARTVDIKTMCNPNGERKGAASFKFVVEFLWSHGDATSPAGWGAYNALLPLSNQRIRIAHVMQGDVAISPENPEWDFEAYVPPIVPHPPADPEDSQKLTLEFDVIGTPAVITDPLAAVTTHPGT